ncbi:MAG: hypothetical protein WD296_16605 [Acidimicrobiia bacterium]
MRDDPAVQHRELMTQDEDLGVFGAFASTAKDEEIHNETDQAVERTNHADDVGKPSQNPSDRAERYAWKPGRVRHPQACAAWDRQTSTSEGSAMKDRPCVFCQNSPINREHAWPDWLTDEFNGMGGFEGFVYSARGKTWRSAKRLTHKVHAPCKACNGGWMSALETAARPILQPLIHGTDVTRGELAREAQHLLALWIAKTCMMLDLTVDPPTVFAPSDYGWLGVHKEPPHGTQTWFTAVKEPARASSYFRKLSQPIPDAWITVETPLEAAAKAKAPKVHGPAYRLTFTIGHLVAQQFGHPTLNLVGLQYNGRIAEPMDSLWPPVEGVLPVWPPETILNDGEAVETAANLPLIAQDGTP